MLQSFLKDWSLLPLSFWFLPLHMHFIALLFFGSLDIHFRLHSPLNMQTFLKCSNVQFQYHCRLTVCNLFSNKITKTKSSLFSIQLLDTLYKNVKLVLQRFKYLFYFNSIFSLNLNESSFVSYSWCNSLINWLFLAKLWYLLTRRVKYL